MIAYVLLDGRSIPKQQREKILLVVYKQAAGTDHVAAALKSLRPLRPLAMVLITWHPLSTLV